MLIKAQGWPGSREPNPDWSKFDVAILEFSVAGQAASLDRLAMEVRQRDRFYYPLDLPAVILTPTLQTDLYDILQRIEAWYLLRCRLALLRGDLNSAWEDMQTLLLVQDRVSQSARIGDVAWSLLVLRSIVNQLQDIVNHPNLDLELWQRIQDDFSRDIFGRSAKSYVDVVVRGEVGKKMDVYYLQGVDDPDTSPGTVQMPGWIKPIAIVDQTNVKLDQVVQLLDAADQRPLWADLQRLHQQLLTRSLGSTSRFRPLQFSNQVVEMCLTMGVIVKANGILNQRMRQLIELCRARLLLEVSGFRLKQGRLPNGLSDIEDRMPREDWIDPYTGCALRWTESEQGITIGPTGSHEYPCKSGFGNSGSPL